MPALRGRPRVRVAPCRFCNKNFKRQEHLKRHERIHTREKPFVCDCGEGFARQDMLVRHRRQTHADELSNGADQEEPSNSPEGEQATLSEGPVPTYTSASAAFEDGDQWASGQVEGGFLASERADDSNLAQATTAPDVQLETFQAQVDQLPDALGISGSSYADMFNLLPPNLGISADLDFLWGPPHHNRPFLPVDFFDTDISAVPMTGTEASSADTMPPELGTDDAQPQPQFMSRLPSLDPDHPVSAPHDAPSSRSDLGSVMEETPDSRRWTVTAELHRRLAADCERHGGDPLAPSFQFPTRHALTRYLEGYLRRFHDHMPFLHIPTFSPSLASTEMLLAFAAAGALYKFEHTTGYLLYDLAQTIVSWRFRQAGRVNMSRLTSFSPAHTQASASASAESNTTSHSSPSSPSIARHSCLSGMDESEKLSLLQAMVVLLALASWGDRSLVPDALGMTSKVAMLARELGISQPDTADDNASLSWEAWATAEERRRTLSVAYIMTNLQSVAFNVPPGILNHEVSLNLPVSGPEWKASSATEWARIRGLMIIPTRSFQQSLALLSRNISASLDLEAFSAFGIYLLIHGLLQQIFFARQSYGCLSQTTGSLPAEFVKQMERALRAWQTSWEAMYESTLDPSSPKGPLGFNATALLRLAHIRLNVSFGPDCQLMTRDPGIITAATVDVHTDNSSRHLERAVLQAIHAMSIPVRLGIGYVARTQTSNWSVQHAFCSLECALFLIHWLQAMAESVDAFGLSSLNLDQVRLLNMVVSVVRETELRRSLDADQGQAKRIRRLAASIATIWADTFKGFHVFEMVHVIGTGLSMLAEKLAVQLG